MPRFRGGRSLFVQARDDPARFADLYVEYYGIVLGYFARRTLDRETAFDLMAETFAQAFSGLPRLRAQDDDQGRAWLWAIARHQLFRWRERGRVEALVLPRLGIERPELAAVEFDRAEELADLDRVRTRVAVALERLSADQQEAVRLRVVEEREYPEIAGRLGVSEQVARARVSRALRTLALMLSERAAIAEACPS